MDWRNDEAVLISPSMPDTIKGNNNEKLKAISSVPKSFCTDFKLFSVMLSSVSNINTVYSNKVSISATASLFEINTIT